MPNCFKCGGDVHPPGQSWHRGQIFCSEQCLPPRAAIEAAGQETPIEEMDEW
ncbi:unnamed protein product, partial [marine sediment metagenome]